MMLKQATHLKKEKLVLLVLLLTVMHSTYSMIEFTAGAGAVVFAGAYMAPRCIEEVEKAQGLVAEGKQQLQRAAAVLEADADVEQVSTFLQNALDDLSGKQITTRPLSPEERALRYGFRETQIFFERWTPSMLWGGGAVLLAGYGISLMKDGVIESHCVRAGLGFSALLVSGGFAQKGFAVWKQNNYLKVDLQRYLASRDYISKTITQYNAQLGDLTFEKQKKEASAKGLFDKLGNALDETFKLRDETSKRYERESDARARLNALSANAHVARVSIDRLTQAKNKNFAKLAAYSTITAGLGLAGIGLLYTSIS